MKSYYIYSDLVYGTYVVEKIDKAKGSICGILVYPSQRAPGNPAVVRELIPYGEGVIKYFDFDYETEYEGEIKSFKDFQTAAIETAIAAANGDGAVLKILCRHLYALPTYTNTIMEKAKAFTRKKVKITNVCGFENGNTDSQLLMKEYL